MTYSAVYCALISKRLKNPISKDDCYCETHHIIPKSEGGLDELDNIVNLTAREHYIAHLLLARIYNDRKMWCALNRLVHGNDFKKYHHISSRMYQSLKTNLSEKMKGRMSPMKGRHLSDEHKRKLSLAHKGKKLSLEHRQKLSQTRKGRKVWNKGKKGLYKTSDETRRKLSLAHKGKTFTEEHRRKLSEKAKLYAGEKHSNFGKHLSEETRAKISEARKLYWKAKRGK